ncbi:hypothetical protein C8A05DRAFT_33799 [Staphylotrichum tortipilum]|uniref:Uncharacterized protein n=1 Tax=Staphylotrichum tortipilum TaxID=2831512 RepID=A0AAN6RTT3_9PEZI|nr:hypothetical protein C8A05DRAFT_33799 [Staphylotrichum longicolle]
MTHSNWTWICRGRAPEDWHPILDHLREPLHRRATAPPRGGHRRRSIMAPLDRHRRRRPARANGDNRAAALRWLMHVHMAPYLGFTSTEDLAAWEQHIVRSHLMMFRLATERLRMVDTGRRKDAMYPEMTGWDAWDYYRHVIVSIVTDEMWAAVHRPENAMLSRG